jgi:hypothetical protein
MAPAPAAAAGAVVDVDRVAGNICAASNCGLHWQPYLLLSPSSATPASADVDGGGGDDDECLPPGFIAYHPAVGCVSYHWCQDNIAASAEQDKCAAGLMFDALLDMQLGGSPKWANVDTQQSNNVYQDHILMHSGGSLNRSMSLGYWRRYNFANGKVHSAKVQYLPHGKLLDTKNCNDVPPIDWCHTDLDSCKAPCRHI